MHMERHRFGADIVTEPTPQLSDYTGARKESNAEPQDPIVGKGASLTDQCNVSSLIPSVSTADRN